MSQVSGVTNPIDSHLLSSFRDENENKNIFFPLIIVPKKTPGCQVEAYEMLFLSVQKIV
jgi:hypothetical protein